MDVTIKMTAPKAEGCGHIIVDYSDGTRTIRRVYHVDELKLMALEDVEPGLRQVVAKTIIDGLKDEKATLTTVCAEEKRVTL
jgi:hypothetical protein